MKPNHQFSVVIAPRRTGYVSTIYGLPAVRHRFVRAGLTPYNAACTALSLLYSYTESTGAEGSIMAPVEVADHIPPPMLATKTGHVGELCEAGKGLLLELTGMETLFKDDERFTKAYHRFKTALEEAQRGK